MIESPTPLTTNPLRRMLGDVAREREGRRADHFPPGDTNFSLVRTHRASVNPLPLLLRAYERYGPIFSQRVFHARTVFMIGPAANHYMTVSHADNFRWRDGSFGDLIPLLGDGLLTSDAAFHDRARRIMMPAFHRDGIEAMVATIVSETDAALDRWRPGEIVDIYEWTRKLAIRIAMRALFGLDPDGSGKGAAAAVHFERALRFYGIDMSLWLVRGPGSPWQRLMSARRKLDEIIHPEIVARRERPGGLDILSLLIEAEDEDGSSLSDEQVRDQVMTLLFAGHDTTSSTITFLLYELARNPAERARLLEESDSVLGGSAPGPEHLGGALGRLELAFDETLRLYPPAWIGPRIAAQDFEFGGYTVPAGTYCAYSSWVSHRLPEVFGDPEAFVPERFTPERKTALPRGAYVPFGGGSRICIGKRLGQTEVRAVVTRVLQRFGLELQPAFTLTVDQAPILHPRGGMPMIVSSRARTSRLRT